MPRISKTQFGQSIVAGMGSGAAPVAQQLHLYLGTQNRKNLSHISAASWSDASPISAGARLFRLVVCSGPVTPNQETLTILDMSPIATELAIAGINRVFLDQVYQNAVEIDFDEPIIVEATEQLNVIMSLSWANGDGIVTPSTSIGRLAWQGWEGDRKTAEFPYKLR